MPNPLTSYVTGLNTAYLNVGSELNNLYSDFVSLATWLDAEGCPNSGAVVNNLNVHIANIRNWLSWGDLSMQHYDILALDWIDDNWPSNSVAVDMNAILDAMWVSLDWQTLLFIAYIDAMRGSISEKTVTETSMANYLRHFLRR